MLKAISCALRRHQFAKIEFPDERKMVEWVKMIELCELMATNVINFMDGLSLHSECNTTTFEQNERIRAALIAKLSHEILPGQAFEIEQEWSGIMCVGDEKKPIIRSLNKNVHAGVRMGGMGIAIGSAVGDALSKMV